MAGFPLPEGISLRRAAICRSNQFRLISPDLPLMQPGTRGAFTKL